MAEENNVGKQYTKQTHNNDMTIQTTQQISDINSMKRTKLLNTTDEDIQHKETHLRKEEGKQTVNKEHEITRKNKQKTDDRNKTRWKTMQTQKNTIQQ